MVRKGRVIHYAGNSQAGDMNGNRTQNWRIDVHHTWCRRSLPTTPCRLRFRIPNRNCVRSHNSAVASLDHFIGPHEHRRWDRQAQSLGGLKVDDQLELRRLLYWEIGGFGAFQNLVNIVGGATKSPKIVG